jgi:hypothetical protein
MGLPGNLVRIRILAEFYTRPPPLNGSQEYLRAAVPEPDPQEPRLRPRSVCQVKKVLVLADGHEIVPAGVSPNLGVCGGGKADIEHVLAFQAPGAQKTSQGSGQLIIDQKLHDT